MSRRHETKATLQLEVTYNTHKTDAAEIAVALSVLLSNALLTEDVLDELGDDLSVSDFDVLGDPDE